MEGTGYLSYDFTFGFDKILIGFRTFFGPNINGDNFPTLRKIMPIYENISDQEDTVSEFNVAGRKPVLYYSAF